MPQMPSIMFIFMTASLKVMRSFIFAMFTLLAFRRILNGACKDISGFFVVKHQLPYNTAILSTETMSRRISERKRISSRHGLPSIRPVER